MRWIIIISLFLAVSKLYSQDTITYPVVDKNTYQQYLDKDWNTLISLGKKALKKDIDYFYLRMRLGIAYYEKKNYTNAIVHFTKALEFNSADETALEYLYYCYKFLNLNKDASLISLKMNNSLKEKLEIKSDKAFFDKLAIETSYNFNSDFANMSIVDTAKLIPGIKKTVVKNYINTFLLVNHPIKNKTDLTLSLTNLSLNSIIQTKPGIPPPGAPKPPDYITDEQKISQNQLYGKFNFHLFKRGDLAFGFHVLNISSKIIRENPNQQNNQQNNTPSTSFGKNFAFFTSFNKDMNKFNLNIFASLSNLDFVLHNQQNISLTYYPFGNLKLYLNSGACTVMEMPSTRRFIYNNKLGIQLTKNAWIETAYSYGDIKNYLENDAFLVYNNDNTIKSKLEAQLIILPKSNLQISLRYYYINNYGDNIYSPINENAIFDFTNRNNQYYKLHSIIGGLTWKL